MKSIKTAVAFTIGTLFAGAAFAQSDFGIERRDAYLDYRIDRGIASGQITPREAVRLESQQEQIERMQARARADGHLSGRERARIDHAQDRLSRNIYRESHDRQTTSTVGRNSSRPYGWDRGNGNGWGRGNSYGNDHRGVGYRGNDHGRFGQRDDHRGNGHSWNRGPSHGPSHGTSTTPRTGSDSHAGRSDRFAGRQAPMQQAQARATPSPRSTTGGNRGSDNDRRSR